MNTIPSVFNFNSAAVRTVVKDGEPWFVASDVCAVLGVKNHRDALQHLDDDEKGVVLNDTLGGTQEMSVVNESGLYSLVLRSRKPEAKPFIKWVTREVLPAIRKTGRYEVPYTVGPTDTLSKEDADQLRDLIRQHADTLPKEQRAGFVIKAWAKLKAHYKTSYRQIPADEFTGALSLIGRHISEGEYMPKPSITVNAETSPISEADILSAAQAELMKPGRMFLTIFGKSTSGQPHPILYPVSEGARMLTDEETVKHVGKPDGFPITLIPALITAAVSRVQAQLTHA